MFVWIFRVSAIVLFSIAVKAILQHQFGLLTDWPLTDADPLLYLMVAYLTWEAAER